MTQPVHPRHEHLDTREGVSNLGAEFLVDRPDDDVHTGFLGRPQLLGQLVGEDALVSDHEDQLLRRPLDQLLGPTGDSPIARERPDLVGGLRRLFVVDRFESAQSAPERLRAFDVRRLKPNISSSAIFVPILVAGGSRLRRNDLSADRYRRIAVWVGGDFVFFVVLFALFTANAGFPLIGYISALRWAATVGSGGGLLVGLFEARAIERAIAAERARIRAEEVARQNERLEEFASIISHDLRNPLNVAAGHLHIAKRQSSSDNLEKATSALERMNQIIDETLALARQGQVIEEPDHVDLARLAEQSWGNVDTAGATLEIDDTVTVSADPDRLKHLFENLFRNAVEHGEREVTIRVGALTDGFYVEDTGPGIPAEKREDVLEPGYSSKDDGTGFGLVIVKQI